MGKKIILEDLVLPKGVSADNSYEGFKLGYNVSKQHNLLRTQPEKYAISPEVPTLDPEGYLTIAGFSEGFDFFNEKSKVPLEKAAKDFAKQYEKQQEEIRERKEQEYQESQKLEVSKVGQSAFIGASFQGMASKATTKENILKLGVEKVGQSAFIGSDQSIGREEVFFNKTIDNILNKKHLSSDSEETYRDIALKTLNDKNPSMLGKAFQDVVKNTIDNHNPEEKNTTLANLQKTIVNKLLNSVKQDEVEKIEIEQQQNRPKM